MERTSCFKGCENSKKGCECRGSLIGKGLVSVSGPYVIRECAKCLTCDMYVFRPHSAFLLPSISIPTFHLPYSLRVTMPKYVPDKTTSTRGYNAPYQMSQSAVRKGYDVPYESPTSTSKQSSNTIARPTPKPTSKQSSSNIAYPTSKPTSKQEFKVPSSNPVPTPKLAVLSEPLKPVLKNDNLSSISEGASAKPRKERRQRNYVTKIKHERWKHRQLLARVLKAGKTYGVQDAGYENGSLASRIDQTTSTMLTILLTACYLSVSSTSTCFSTRKLESARS